ncbi:MAG TPA: ABC transporter ATP-binding protein [Terriglobia bacterium]|nr:ABC transporter ATP-binding protein [Terriglobia bacterium]
MSESIIQVSNLSKRYVINHARKARYVTLRETLSNSVISLGRRVHRAFRRSAEVEPPSNREEIWALRDVSFEVNEGERLGIIGRNGAGKSTLLKILSRITDPTRGRVRIAGRVASLLEVGTGFHLELTGRENIFLNGAILGMSKSEIKSKFDEIVAFSEVERFLDTPLKRYSSGMSVRLAFAVAAHLDPEILVVDEVLAVGDVAFQRKCLGKMRDVAQCGRTVLFVSHDMGAINSLCEKAVLLHSGSVVMTGSARAVVAHYLEASEKLYSPLRGSVRDYGEFRVIGIRATQSGRVTEVIDCREPFSITIEYDVMQVVRNSRLFLMLRDRTGQLVIVTSDYDDPTDEALERRVGRFESAVTIPGKLLKAGPLYATIGADVRDERVVFLDADVLHLDIVDSVSDALSGRHQRDSAIAPVLAWKTAPVADQHQDLLRDSQAQLTPADRGAHE